MFKLNLDAGVNSFSNNNSAERSKIEFDILDSLGDKISFITEQIINNDKILSLNNNWNKNSISTKYNYSKFTSVIEYFNEKRELKTLIIAIVYILEVSILIKSKLLLIIY